MKIKVFVADQSAAVVEQVMNYFGKVDNIDVVGNCADGESLVNVFEQGKIDFDLLLLDLFMPKKDGLGILSYMQKKKIDKKVIVMTPYINEHISNDLRAYDIRYLVVKPVNLDDLSNLLLKNYTENYNNEGIVELDDRELQIRVTKLLHALGIPSNIKGYQFIRTAILMVYYNPDFIGCITKKLYPDLSVRFNTTIQRVERAIRHAIEVSWLRGDIDLMEEIFGHSVDIDRAKPTNSEFIVTIADKLRLEMINI